MKQKRGQLVSLAERVQSLTLAQRDGLFCQLQSQVATFKWQNPDQFYGDATGPMLMCTDFRIASDGRQCWWHAQSANDTNFIVCPATDVGELNVSICDPFDLTRRAPAVAAARLRLKYDRAVKLGAADCFQLEAWQIVRIPKEHRSALSSNGGLMPGITGRHKSRNTLTAVKSANGFCTTP
jgi:hypothetical protein